MWQDVRIGLRILTRQPGFALAAVLTLALGVGANAAVFRVAWQVMLKPLPYPEAGRLVRVWEAYGKDDVTNAIAPGNYFDWQRDTQSFEAIAAHSVFRNAVNLTGAGEPEQLTIRAVTGQYFRVFGMPPLAGRWLDDSDTNPGTNTVVLSEGLWMRRFGGDRAVVGRQILLSGTTYTIAGVMPAAFTVAAGDVDAWSGYGFPPQQMENRGAHYLGAVARLKPGVTITQAIADVKAAAHSAAERFPATNAKTSATVKSIEDERGGTLRSAIGLLAGAAGFVLLIACANLASLQLARGVSRQREFGIRTALGASRGRIVVQLLIEGLVIATLGAAAGVALSSWLLAGLARVAPAAIRAGVSSGLDGATFAAATGLALVSTVLFAALPAWRAAARGAHWTRQRVDTGDRRSAVIRTALVTAQLALAVMLLIGATLLVTSLQRVLNVDPGFDASGIVAFDTSLAKFDSYAAREGFLTRIADELATVPGVQAACAINEVPFDQTFNMTYVPEGQTTPIGAFPRTITPGCFDVLRLRLRAGRVLNAHEPVRAGIVTERFARSAWKDANPIGQRVHLGTADGALIEIVGVVADSVQTSLESKPYPQFYEAAGEQAAFPPSRMLVRTSVPPASMLQAVKTAVRRVDPEQPVARLRTLDELVNDTLATRTFNLDLVGGFAIVALALSAIGIFGLLAHVVAERTREIGIRMALGAAPGSVVRLMLRRAWIAVAPGLAMGLTAAYLSSGVLRGFVFQISPTTPAVYVWVAAGLGAVALLAAWIPARRAARVDPMQVLRN